MMPLGTEWIIHGEPQRTLALSGGSWELVRKINKAASIWRLLTL